MWFDKVNILPGRYWEQEFADGLLTSSCFVCLLSRNAINHPSKPSQNFNTLTSDSKPDNVLMEWTLGTYACCTFLIYAHTLFTIYLFVTTESIHLRSFIYLAWKFLKFITFFHGNLPSKASFKNNHDFYEEILQRYRYRCGHIFLISFPCTHSAIALLHFPFSLRFDSSKSFFYLPLQLFTFLFLNTVPFITFFYRFLSPLHLSIIQL